MSFAYKVEELLALRDSVSESAVSIDKFADEDRGKAEKLLKEHGSPPGLRVTAGGRIVPSDLAPLGTSRFPDNTFKPPTLRIAPGNVMPMQAQSNNNTAPRIEFVAGQPVIKIGDRMFALPAVNPNSAAPMDTSISMDPNARQIQDPPTLSTHGSMSGLPYGPPRANSTSPFAGLDLNTLKAQQSLKKQELRQVEQTEVLQASHQTEAWRAGIIEKKRCLIVELDALRKSITALENDNPAAAQSASFLGPIGTIPGSAPLPSFMPQLQQAVPQPIYGFPAANPYTPMMMYQQPYGVFPGFPPAEPTSVAVPPSNPPHSPGAASRRSHAVAIKPPQESTAKPALNPKSPTYEPPSKSESIRNAVPPTPSPPKRSPWRTQREPHNENSALPLTPEKHWPASPWNEAHSGRSRTNEPTSKLTSWPEAFGKQQSSSSLRQSATRQPSAAISERAPVIGSYVPESASSSSALKRSDSNQRTGTDENWPFSRKAVTHVPSTYQEGYQSGYDHIGMPDDPEVLQGYIQGLLHFLSDESKKGRLEAPVRDPYLRSIDSRTTSLRGLVAGSLPHDSAVSMTFNRNGVPTGNQENLRSSKDSLSASLRRDSAYSPQGSAKDVPVSYAFFNEAAYMSRQRNASGLQYPDPASQLSERLASGRQVAFTPGDAEMGRLEQEKITASRIEPPMSNGGSSRQFSGAQLQNRGYGTPLATQRFYPTPKEMSPNGLCGNAVPPMRPFANHRLSGLDGAMDDLADLVVDTHVVDKRVSTGGRSLGAPIPVETEVEEQTASCFKTSSGKGKQKAAASPAKPSGHGRDNSISSPNPPSSPKKSGERSPAKAKLEQVTNKFRRTKKDDPRTMSPEDKARRSEKWRQRFRDIKKTELEEIEQHRKNTRT
ncbi:hypothetical protein CC86DRAFT_415093 [Ophiobolus disseminans]|uniref:Uncharacterized protein n=1 Tax=Ophiobolus disseminans TaxID=1469910 RepID=A0A6A7AJD8_9PLEO|nr:hypothetical protein CC86DRAFT_415093 [Ophiobolus disseminans]